LSFGNEVDYFGNDNKFTMSRFNMEKCIIYAKSWIQFQICLYCSASIHNISNNNKKYKNK